MIKGHLLDAVAIIPFETDNESAGRPLINHSLIMTGSPNCYSTEKLAEKGTSFFIKNCCQLFSSLILYDYVKVPT